MDIELVDDLYPRLDSFVYRDVTPAWLEIEGAVGPPARKAIEAGSNEGRRAQDALLRIAGKLDNYTRDVATWIATGGDVPPEAAKNLEHELAGLRQAMDTITWSDKAANARALRAIDRLAKTLRWENVEAKVLS